MSLDRIITVDNFLNPEEIAEVLQPLRDHDWHWFPPSHPYWDYAFTAPMGLLHRKLLEQVPSAIPNESFFFRYKPPHHALPRIHTDTGFGEDNVIVYLTGPADHGTGFWEHTETGTRYFTPGLGICAGGRAWTEYERVVGVPGRAVFHSVDAYHKAWPEVMPEERIIWVCRYVHREVRDAAR